LPLGLKRWYSLASLPSVTPARAARSDPRITEA